MTSTKSILLSLGSVMCVCCVCVCVRIGELREAMADILRRQCDYDPASGDSYDFDR